MKSWPTKKSGKMKIEKLAKIFVKYRIYPPKCYKVTTPVNIFLKDFPDNYYSKDLKKFISFQDYDPEKRGADLPWWGKHYFDERKEFRVMMVSQDSLSTDAGSIVLFAHLISVIENPKQYENYRRQLTLGNFSFTSWDTMKEILLQKWRLNPDFLYITDASKVYNINSGDFDAELSQKLLEEEIEFCNPNLLILLGSAPLKLLNSHLQYKEIVESKKIIKIKGINCVVAPFPIGRGRTQKSFKKKIEIATKKIRACLKN